jgi:uncharacterized C2H2 Zn-finger protein
MAQVGDVVKIQDLDKIARCDKCKMEFPSKSVALRPLNGKTMMAPLMKQIIVVESDGEIVGVTDTRFSKPGSSMMHCPLCDAMHVFGFDRPEVKV